MSGELRFESKNLTAHSLVQKLKQMTPRDLASIEMLDCFNNKLEYVPRALVDLLPNLLDVDLGGNPIRRVPTFLVLSYTLEGLYLSGCNRLPEKLRRDAFTKTAVDNLCRDIVETNKPFDRAVVIARLVMCAQRFSPESTFAKLQRDTAKIVAEFVLVNADSYADVEF